MTNVNSDYELGFKHGLEYAGLHKMTMFPHIEIRDNLTQELYDEWDHACSGMVRVVTGTKIKPEIRVKVTWHEV